MTQSEYEAMFRRMDRIEAECGCELPSCDDTLRARAERALACDDPPIGDDATFCRRIVKE